MASQPKHAEKESDTAFEQPEFLYRELEGQIDAAYERSNSMMHKMSVTAAARNSRTIKVIRNAMEDTQATLASLEVHYPEVMQLSRYLNTASKLNGFLSHSAAADVLLGSTKCPVTSLPPELALAIFKLLDPITSTCLGLTCKAFYRIHKSIHGKVPLKDLTQEMNLQFSID
jgi:hypothetical protein